MKPSKKRGGGKTDETLVKRYVKSVTSQKPVKAPKEDKKKPDKKNPRDVSIDKQAQAQLGLTPTTERDRSEKRQRPDAPAEHLLPRREAQTRETLDLGVNRAPNAPRQVAVDDVLEGAAADGSLYKNLIEVNQELYRQRNQTTFSLQDLVRLGLLSPNAVPISLKRTAATQQLQKDVAFMRSQLQQLVSHRGAGDLSATAAGEQEPHTMVVGRAVQRGSPLSPEGRTVQVKMSLLFGPLNYAFGYEKRASSDHRAYIGREWDRDREQRKLDFFLGDELEPEVGEWRGQPLRFKLFRQMLARNQTRFQQRFTTHRDASQLVPRPDLETVSRREVREARRRPCDGEQLCYNGARCVGRGIGTEPSLWYTMRAFYTEAQRKRQAYVADALCVDCYFHRWTQRCIDNITTEREESLPINHFTVKVGPGEYGALAMLPVKFNRLETGICGHVPFYHDEHRQMRMSLATTTERALECDAAGRKRRKVDTETESMIVESGVLDF